MQDLLQLACDEEVAELFDGVNAGSKIKLRTVSEIDEAANATVDLVHDDVSIEDEGEGTKKKILKR